MGISFTVPGVPAPQGSKVRSKWGVREDNPATRPWRNAVSWEARAVMSDTEPFIGPLRVVLVLFFPRPQAHYRSGKNADQLKPSAPSYVTKKPDGDKLARACLDSMSGIIYRDDAQVCDLRIYKLYGQPHAKVVVTQIPDEFPELL